MLQKHCVCFRSHQMAHILLQALFEKMTGRVFYVVEHILSGNMNISAEDERAHTHTYKTDV